jgi:hypothetical protein
MPCPTCGLTRQTWEVLCVRCRKTKYPVAADRPDPYVCTLCRLDSPRSAASRKGAAVARLKKAAAARGNTPRRDPGGDPTP